MNQTLTEQIADIFKWKKYGVDKVITPRYHKSRLKGNHVDIYTQRDLDYVIYETRKLQYIHQYLAEKSGKKMLAPPKAQKGRVSLDAKVLAYEKHILRLKIANNLLSRVLLNVPKL
ncbi:hypothetical protein L4D09_19920 [Photobacterium makurazakiensis]|uniref:hypothetical protein n=1 Tax=Photobacterium makurazakiensis TaxID=2910234 RepID=UPI003D0FCA26